MKKTITNFCYVTHSYTSPEENAKKENSSTSPDFLAPNNALIPNNASLENSRQTIPVENQSEEIPTIAAPESIQHPATEECGNCSTHAALDRFVNYCNKCNARICRMCEQDIATGDLFLDAQSDYAYVQTRCFRCNKKILLYGTPRSGYRQWIYIERIQSEEYYRRAQPSRSFKNKAY